MINKNFLILLFFSFSLNFFSQQTEDIKLNPEKVKKYLPYMEFKHGGGPGGFEAWKNNNKMLYVKELWYYSESFYIKRDHFKEGVAINEEIIDISRFEHLRKENEEAIVTAPGFKDVIVMIPGNKLIYKPQ